MGETMSFPEHSRLNWLLFFALFAPFLLLSVFSIRMILQERELEAKRQLDERQQLLSQIRLEVENRLERIKLRELSVRATFPSRIKYQDPATVLIATIKEERLILPWEEELNSLKPWGADVSSPFAKKMESGEQLELKLRKHEDAAVHYREALKLAVVPSQAATARLCLARTLAKVGHQSEAQGQFKTLLSMPSNPVDDQGIPFKFYAASQLCGVPGSANLILNWMENLRADWQWLPRFPST
jgi:hypothetical protein